MNGELWITGQPYPDLGQHSIKQKAVDRDDVIVLTSRFRSGSTLLWNVFRMMRNFTPYYQPFHERRWLDPAQNGAQAGATERMLIDSWREYAELECRKGIFKDAWARRNLFMDADSSDPDMKRYVEALIDGAACRPVLHCNRIDFRLPWFRRHFPRATIVHLYRHPRDQWLSCLLDPDKVTPRTTTAEFAPHDHYGLHSWAADLQRHFPFLDQAAITHPYQWSYYLWKLSFLYGRRHAHISLAYEDLLQDPRMRFIELLDQLRVREYTNIDDLARMVDKPRSGRWLKWADDGWFLSHEMQCENVLAEFFRNTGCEA